VPATEGYCGAVPDSFHSPGAPAETVTLLFISARFRRVRSTRTPTAHSPGAPAETLTLLFISARFRRVRSTRTPTATRTVDHTTTSRATSTARHGTRDHATTCRPHLPPDKCLAMQYSTVGGAQKTRRINQDLPYTFPVNLP